MEDRKFRVAITHGDTNGIGYELIFKTFAEPSILELCTPIIYGSPKVAAYHRNALDMQTNYNIISQVDEARDGKVNLLAAFTDEVKVELGQNAPEGGKAAVKALDKALDDLHTGGYDALVSMPLNPASMKNVIEDFAGQTAYIEQKTEQTDKSLTMMLNENMRIALATSGLPVNAIAGTLSKELIVDKATTLFDALKRDFRISSPRIAVLALNPRKAVDNALGKEEQEIIRPAIIELEKKGIQAFGPFTAEEFFGQATYLTFDAVLAMYDDQALAPFYSLDLGCGVCYIAGLPVVCTSAAYATPHEKAGQGVADENSFRQAIYAAIDIARNRIFYDEARQNPLPKLYHEKRDESEKVRFNVPKKNDTGKRQQEQP